MNKTILISSRLTNYFRYWLTPLLFIMIGLSMYFIIWLVRAKASDITVIPILFICYSIWSITNYHKIENVMLVGETLIFKNHRRQLTINKKEIKNLTRKLMLYRFDYVDSDSKLNRVYFLSSIWDTVGILPPKNDSNKIKEIRQLIFEK